MVIASPAPDEPNLNWTLAQLEQFIQVCLKRTAVDAWMTGKALKLARRKVKEAQRKWTDWKRSHGYSDTMVSRYIRLYELYESADALANMGVIKACEKAGILTPRGKAASQSEDKHRPEQDGPYAWAIDNGDDTLLDCLAELDDYLAAVLALGDKERLRSIVGLPDARTRMESIRKQLDLLLAV